MRLLTCLTLVAAVAALTTEHAWPLLVMTGCLWLRLTETEDRIQTMKKLERRELVRSVMKAPPPIAFSRRASWPATFSEN